MLIHCFSSTSKISLEITSLKSQIVNFPIMFYLKNDEYPNRRWKNAKMISDLVHILEQLKFILLTSCILSTQNQKTVVTNYNKTFSLKIHSVFNIPNRENLLFVIK